jgi:membrane protein DedA with SNARE-associated domain
MSTEIIQFINVHGYLAIFILLFLQEMGVPNPIPNEFILMFSGYLTYVGVLKLPYVLCVAVSADFIGTNVLYTLFFFFGSYLIKHKPRWINVSEETIKTFSTKIAETGKWKLFLLRLIPFIRGYVSIACGLIKIKPSVFSTTVLFSAIVWSLTYIIVGKLAGPYWSILASHMTGIKSVTLVIVTSIIFLLLLRHIIRRLWLSTSN